MSIIAAVRKNGRTVIAADSQTSFGESQRIPTENSRTPKIRRIGASIIGGTGWAVYDCILTDHLADRPAPDLGDERAIFSFFMELWRALHENYPFVNDQAQAKDSPFGDLDASFLIANTGGLFHVANDMDVSRFEQYYAIGSGSEYALGSLHSLYGSNLDAEALARRAVDSAIAFDITCGSEVMVLSC
jgi:ATP-dependent protease HslVU (ClpYQ) peptidase subunit